MLIYGRVHSRLATATAVVPAELQILTRWHSCKKWSAKGA